MCDKCRFTKIQSSLKGLYAPRIKELEIELEKVTIENVKLDHDIKDLRFFKRELNIKLQALKVNHEINVSQIEPQLEELLGENERLDHAINNSKHVIEDSQSKIKELTEKEHTIQIKVTQVESERDQVKREVKNLACNIKKLEEVNTNSIVYSAIHGCMCDECKVRILGPQSLKMSSEDMNLMIEKEQKCSLF